ncbi:MAG: hypothetical protein NTV93_16880 [Verrucomicrobia bacterium]|nr:hypothetical protein [Verrucomicrobiota bacterium]
MTQLLPINESEAVFASFNDSHICTQLTCALTPVGAQGFYSSVYWDQLKVSWDHCKSGATAGFIDLPVDLPVEGFNEFVFCLTIPQAVSVRFLVERAGGSWEPLGVAVPGTLTRQEIVRPIPAPGFHTLRVEAIAQEETPQTISLIWFGIRNSALAALVAKNKVRWNPEWRGLIKPDAEWGGIRFRRGLLFDDKDLAGLRAKKDLPGWSSHFQKLEAAARKAMERIPEDDLAISDFAPFSDERYVRTPERGRMPFYYDALRLAIVGLVNDDKAMIRHALRYLMCMLHLKHWSPSGETRLTGSTWDQRCFTEEMMTTSVALLMDWLDSALTDRARELGTTMLWDRGLAIIERDMAKFEYVHHMNQGAWFCRARVLGGLFLEKEWPQLGQDYVERAMGQLRATMDRYVLADGGMDEGPMYLLLTMETILGALHAYARARGADVRTLLPDAFPHMAQYFEVLAQTSPGLHIPDGDCATESQNSDTCPMLAALFPGSVYARLAAGGLLKDRPFCYTDHYVGTGVFSFIFGPDHIAEAQSVGAPFSLLSVTGLAGSYRKAGERSLRLVLAGSKANPSHAHRDKGGFFAEVDAKPTFIDRGQVRYDDPRVRLLSRTENHNTLAPSFDGITTIEQITPPSPLIPTASGDENSFRASLDLTPVWEGSMRSCARSIDSPDLEGWIVEDTGELCREGQVVFFLQSPMPFEGNAGDWTCGQVAIHAPWAVRADTAEHLIDCEFRKIHRLRLWSAPLTSFHIKTTFRRVC